MVDLGGLRDLLEVGGRHDLHGLRGLGRCDEEARDEVDGIGCGLHEPQG